MKKKILFVSIIAALLMVSMPFVSTLQAANSPMISTTKTTTVDYNLDQQQVLSLLKVAKLRATNPSDQALCQQAIQYVYIYGMNWDCIIILTIFIALAGFALGNLGFGLTNLYDWLVDGEGFVDIETLLEQLYNAGGLGYAAYVIWISGAIPSLCLPNSGMAQQSSQTVTSTNNAPQTTGCSLCSK